MNGSSKRKSEQLNMSFNKADSRLKKMILFDLVKKLDLDICYRCNNKIENIGNLSIEHKIPWMYSVNPIELFFDLKNISFSHLKCNKKRYGKMSKEFCLKIRDIRLNEKKIMCSICNKLLSKCNYNQHMKVHTKKLI